MLYLLPKFLKLGYRKIYRRGFILKHKAGDMVLLDGHNDGKIRKELRNAEPEKRDHFIKSFKPSGTIR